jgi:hypothetical protein
MAKPKAVEIRGYNVGFGDCFLLTFEYAKEKKHVLIDFGTTQPPAGKMPSTYMLEVAEQIKKDCDGHLDAVIETHRHADHISGFATGTKGKRASGDVIAECADKSTVVIQPWTEDPDAPKDSKGPRGSVNQTRKAFTASLDSMHAVAESVVAEVKRMRPEKIDTDDAVEDDGDAADIDVTGSTAGKGLVSRLAFIGEDNVKNLSAVKNLINMVPEKNHRYVYYGADSGLGDVLPGVKVRVLGPPTIAQSNSVLKQRSADKEEFWMLRNRFWSTQRLAAGETASAGTGTPIFPKAKTIGIPRSSRWFVRRLRGVRAKSLLELVTILDSVMNNTSVILLFEVGGRKLLFPGDAQIENWSYALSRDLELLAEVDLYKVGHHGSRNATPKTLYENFKKRGEEGKKGRMMSLISTKSGKHGNDKAHTEVPRKTLVKALQDETEYVTTQKLRSEICFIERFDL